MCEMSRRAGLALAIAWLGLAALPAAGQTYAESTDVVAVEVPVQVIKDGEPVRGLTADNFEVSDGRKKAKITGFEALDLTAPATPAARQAAGVPVAARRHFLLLFDLSFSEPKSVVQARGAAKKLVVSLHPTDMVAVATYTASKGPQLVLGFTADRRQIGAAIDTLGVPQLVDRSPDPLRVVVTSLQAELNNAAPASTRGQENRQANEQQMLDTLKQFSLASERANVSAQKAAVGALTRSLADLAKMMGAVDGRKMVVYLSEGYDASLLRGTEDAAERSEMDEAAASGEYWKVDSEKRYGDTKTGNQVEKMLDEFRRADCVIQAVDIGGLRAQGDLGFQRTGGKDSLLQMAKGTGGELYENTNDLGAAMGEMLKRTGVTYVLTYQPEGLKRDGSYHPLKVELKNVPRGARIVARPGYYAPRPYAQQSPLQKLLEAANGVMSGEESGAIATSVLAAPFEVAGDKAYVPVLIEVDGKSLTANTQGTTLPTEIYVYALDETGAVHDFLSQTLGIDLTKNAAALKQSGLKFFGHLDLLPGSYSLRVLVRNGVTGASGLRVVPVKVPAFAQNQPALLPPFFPEPPNKWLLAREAPRGDAKPPAYPFMLQQQAFIPGARPVLAEGQEARLALVGYNLGAGELKADSKVLTPDGKEVAPADLKVLDRESGSSPERLAATFRPPKLAPGPYVLRVTLTNAAGVAQTSTAPFLVAAAAPPAPHG